MRAGPAVLLCVDVPTITAYVSRYSWSDGTVHWVDNTAPVYGLEFFELLAA